MAASSIITKKDHIYFRLSVLSYRYSSSILSKIVEEFCYTKILNFEQFLDKHKHDLFHIQPGAGLPCCSKTCRIPFKKILLEAQWSLLYVEVSLPSSHTHHAHSPTNCSEKFTVKPGVQIADCDVSLLCTVILNIPDLCAYMLLELCSRIPSGRFNGFQQFLWNYQHDIFHLKDSQRCCRCNSVPSVCPRPIILVNEWNILFTHNIPPCPVTPCSCCYAPTTNVTVQSVNFKLLVKLVKHIGPLASIRTVRNEISHPTDTFREPALNSLWVKLESALCEILHAVKDSVWRSDIIKKIKDLRTCSIIGRTAEEFLQNLPISCQEREELERIKDAIIVRNIIDQSMQERQLRMTNGFVETRAYQRVLETLLEHHMVYIIGLPGDGKTTLSVHAMHYLLNQPSGGNIEPLILKNLSEIRHVVDFKKKFVILLDNVFGETFKVNDKISNWRDYAFIIECSVKKGSYVIVTSRKDIFKQCEHHLPMTATLKEPIVDLAQDDVTLTYEEKYSILKSHKIIDQSLVKEILECNTFAIGFPQCVSIISGMNKSPADAIKTCFEVPMSYFKRQFQILRHEDFTRYLLLVMVFGSNNRISRSTISDMCSEQKSFLSDICPFKDIPPVRHLILAADSFVGTYLRFDTFSAEYIIAHTTICEGIALSLWESNAIFVIKHGPPPMLTKLQIGDSQAISFGLKTSYMSALYDRLGKILGGGHTQNFEIIASMMIWQYLSKIREFICHLVDNNVSISKCLDQSGRSLLVHAAARGRICMVQQLTEQIFDDKQVSQALVNAVQNEHFEIVVYLVHLNQILVDTTVIFEAIKSKNSEIFKFLLGHINEEDLYQKRKSSFYKGLYAEKFDSKGISVHAIEEIFLSGNLRLAEVLAEKYPIHDLILCNPRLLEFAAYSGNIQLAEMLFTNGAQKCEHLLWWSTRSGSLGMTKYLVDKGCSRTSKTKITCGEPITTSLMKTNELHNACAQGNLELIKFLVDTCNYTCLLYDEAETGILPFHLTCYSDSLDCFEYIASLQQRVKVLTSIGSSALHFACERGNLDFVNYLISNHGFSFDAKNSEGFSPMQYAVKSGSIKMFQYLLERGCCIYETTVYGQTLLHIACLHGNTKIVRYLLDYIPALYAQESEQCLSETESVGHRLSGGNQRNKVCCNCRENSKLMTEDIIYFLLKEKDVKGQSAIHCAARSGSVELFKYLTSIDCHINKDKTGESVIHNSHNEGYRKRNQYITDKYPVLVLQIDMKKQHVIANTATSGSVTEVNEMTSAQCDVFEKDNDGMTVMLYASNMGHLELVQCLAENYPDLLKQRDKKNQSAILHAGFSGSVSVVKYLVCKQSDIYERDNAGRTIILNACNYGHLELVQYLSENYPDLLKQRDKENQSAILHAGFSGSVNVVKYLVCKQSDIYERDNAGRTIILIACGQGHLELVQYLSENYPDLLKHRDKENQSAILYAGFSGSVSVVKYLVCKQSDIYERDNAGRTIILIACGQGHFELVQYLSENYPDLLKQRDKENQSAILHAGFSGSVSVVKYLISKQCDIYERDKAGSTIMLYACNQGHFELVQYLSDSYPKLLKQRDKKNKSAILLAGFSGSVSVVKYLVCKQSDIYERDNAGRTIILIACNYGHLELVQYLSENYPDLLKQRDKENQSAILHAGFSGSVSVVKYLISKKCDIYERDNAGRTIILIACGQGHLELVQYLAESYPDLLEQRGKENQSAILHAGLSGSVSVVKYLISKQCDIYERDKAGRTIMLYACNQGHFELVQYLAESYPDLLEQRDKKNQSAILHAGFSGSVTLVQYMVSVKCDIHDRDNVGRTIMFNASNKGHFELVKYLAERYPELLNQRDV